MSRIGKAYEARFRALLLRLHARKLQRGVDWLLARGAPARSGKHMEAGKALCARYETLRKQVTRWEARSSTASPAPLRPPPRFLCDSGLGGLARWLRAAGYEAFWFADMDDAEVLRKARELGAILLTTDSLMMQRGVLRDGIVPAFWLPPVLKKREQLAAVLREFSLPLREPRCMSCGGELRRTDKELLRERIPPKTWRWQDDYFVCAGCGRLFWRGTHWQKIDQALQSEVVNSA